MAIPRQHNTGERGSAGVARSAASAAVASTTPVGPAARIDVGMFIACPTRRPSHCVAYAVCGPERRSLGTANCNLMPTKFIDIIQVRSCDSRQSHGRSARLTREMAAQRVTTPTLSPTPKQPPLVN